MSRHELAPRSDCPARAVVIGWDRPLETFFVQVTGTRGSITVWRGTRRLELPTPLAAIAIASRYALIPAHLEDQLRADRSADAGPDGPAQAFLKKLGLT